MSVVYELAERALDGPVIERIKEHVSQVFVFINVLKLIRNMLI